MRLIHTAPLAAAILLAACGGDADTDDDGAVSGEEVAAEAAGAIKPQPGQYRTHVRAARVRRARRARRGEAADAGADGRRSEARRSRSPICLTPEQAAANGPEQMVKNMAEGNCTIARFDVSGGTIVAEMQCTGPTGGTSHVLMDGQMTRRPARP